MIEKTIANYLSANAAYPWKAMCPKTVSVDKYGLFEKTNSQGHHLFTSVFAFQSFAPTLQEAIEVSDDLKETIFEMVELDDVVSVKLQNEYNFTDTATKQPRYQAVFTIMHY